MLTSRNIGITKLSQREKEADYEDGYHAACARKSPSQTNKRAGSFCLYHPAYHQYTKLCRPLPPARSTPENPERLWIDPFSRRPAWFIVPGCIRNCYAACRRLGRQKHTQEDHCPLCRSMERGNGTGGLYPPIPSNVSLGVFLRNNGNRLVTRLPPPSRRNI